MKKLKITKVNILLLVVVMLLTLIPELVQFVLDKYWNIDIARLILNNEGIKTIVLIVNEYVLVLLPVIVFAILYKIEIKKTLRLNPVGVPAMVLTVIMACSVWVISQFVTIVFYHIYSALFGRPSNDITELIPHMKVWGFFLIVLTPAICEEVLFRGVVLRAYENLGTFRAIFISALLFSAIHLSVLRFIGPLFIGILSGYIVVRSNSIIPGIITHFTFNGISMSLFYVKNTLPEQAESFPTTAEYIALSAIVLISAVVLASCLLAFKYFTEPRRNDYVNQRKKISDLLLFNINTCEQIEFNKPQNSRLQDFTAIITHWPIVIIILIIGAINVSELLAVIM